MATTNRDNLALLIDGDNASPRIITGLMAEIAEYGNASVRRIYGDFTSPAMKGWKACLLDHSIQPMQQFPYTTGKNSTDGAMIIDAMDLLYTNRFAGFCIVSSDSDFTRLAVRIREQGVIVYGFGERKTNNAFIRACDKFMYFDVLNNAADPPEEAQNSPPPQQQQAEEAPWIPTGPRALSTSQSTSVFPHRPHRRALDKAALEGLALAVSKTKLYNDEGYVNLADVGAYLNNYSPDVHARNYGYERLREFIKASGLVDMQMKDMGNHPPVAVRLKDNVARPPDEL
jgi:hypothetical protein